MTTKAKTKTKKTVKGVETKGAVATAENKKDSKRTAKAKPKKNGKDNPSKATSKTLAKPNIKNKNPQTMEELLALTGMEFRALNRGDIIEGTISEIGPKSVYVDIGAKTEGMIIDKDYRLAEAYIKTLQPGDKIEAYVLSPENDSGQILLSVRAEASKYVWKQLEENKSQEEVLSVTVTEVNRGGAIVNVIDELDGFVPGSQFTSSLQNDMEQLIGQEIEVKIIDLDKEEKKIILSEKAVSEAEDIARKRKVLENLKPEQKYKGQVTKVVPFGVFVSLSPVGKSKKSAEGDEYVPEGLVHISEISWEKVDDPQELYHVGDPIDVQVLEVFPKVGKLSFSIKRLTQDPWENIAEQYPVDKQVKGEVSEVMPFGIFVKLEDGISGLIHSSKLLGQTFKSGDKVNCYIESVDKKNRRLSLGLVLTAKPVGYK